MWSPGQVNTGVVYGEIGSESGSLCIVDERSGHLYLVSGKNKETLQRIYECSGERLKLTFRMLYANVIEVLQAERKPEEYAPISLRVRVFTSEECTLYGDIPRTASAFIPNSLKPDIQRVISTSTSPCISSYLFSTSNAGPEGLTKLRIGFGVVDASLILSDGAYSLADKVIDAEISGSVALVGDNNYEHPRYQAIKYEVLASVDDYNQSIVNEKSQRLYLPFREEEEEEEGLEPELEASPVVAEAKKRKRRTISTTLRRQILLRDDHRCVDCGASPDRDPFVSLEIDHRIPVSKGGTNDPENLQTLCWACNNGKRDQVDHKLQWTADSDPDNSEEGEEGTEASAPPTPPEDTSGDPWA